MKGIENKINSSYYRRQRYMEMMKKRRRRTYIGLALILAFILGVGILMVVKYNSAKYIKYLEFMKSGEEVRLSDARKAYEKSGLQPEIKEINYEWGDELDYNNKPQYLVYHHTASTQISPEKINEMHSNKGWSGIGYHYYIRKDGVIYRGRPEESVGAHAIGRNKDSIGICLEGNFEQEVLTEQQKESLEKLSIQLILKYNIKETIGHKDVYETLCPGKNFPMDIIKNDVADKIITISKN